MKTFMKAVAIMLAAVCLISAAIPAMASEPQAAAESTADSIAAEKAPAEAAAPAETTPEPGPESISSPAAEVSRQTEASGQSAAPSAEVPPQITTPVVDTPAESAARNAAPVVEVPSPASSSAESTSGNSQPSALPTPLEGGILTETVEDVPVTNMATGDEVTVDVRVVSDAATTSGEEFSGIVDDLESMKTVEESPMLLMALGSSGGKTVYLYNEGLISYGGYITHKYRVRIDGQTSYAYCLEPPKAGPADSNYQASPTTNALLAKALYYMMGGPAYGQPVTTKSGRTFKYGLSGNISSTGAATDDEYALSHCILSYIYAGDDAFRGLESLDVVITGVKSWAAQIADFPDPPAGYTAYTIATPGQTMGFAGQVVAQDGYVCLTKTSANTGISKDNRMYSLEGAVYGVYSDSACTKSVGTLTTKADGSTNTLKLAAGTYYVKETSASKGYLLDPAVYTVNVSTNNSESSPAVVKANEVPASDSLFIDLRKMDTEGKNVSDVSDIPQGSASLSGAEFRIDYYDAASASGSAKKSWTFRSNESGIVDLTNTAFLKDNAQASSLYKDGSGKVTYPLGTYVITETKAPAGYKPMSGSLTGHVVLNGQKASFSWDSASSGRVINRKDGSQRIGNEIFLGGVRIRKADLDTKEAAQGDASLADAAFAIVNKSKNPVVVNGKACKNGETVLTIATDAEGIAASADRVLPYGSYEIHETDPSTGYLLNNKWAQSFRITRDGEKVDLTGKPVDEPIIRGGVRIHKQDLDLQKSQAQGDATIEAASFVIVNKSAGKIVAAGKTYAPGAAVMTIKTDAQGLAETAPDALPYGTYEIHEAQPSTGYLLPDGWSETFKIREDGKIVDLTGKPCSEPVIRGGVRIKKQDADYRDDAPQGDAVLKNAAFAIVNRSRSSVVVDGKEYQAGQVVKTIRTNAKGIAATSADTLPYGTYEIHETDPSSGYLLNKEWSQTFEIRESGKIVDLTGKPCDETVIRGGVAIIKHDKELDTNEALGGATLEGIEFTITNASECRVFVNGESFETGKIVTKLITDAEGKASLDADALPYGTYTIRETKTNETYLLTDGKSRTFTIRESGKVVTFDTSENGLIFRNQVVRNDIHFNKIADTTNERMAEIPFVITQVATGEKHVIVTDANGTYNSQNRTNPHSRNTNGNDHVLEGYVSEADLENETTPGTDAKEPTVIKTADLDDKAGLWFSLGQKGSHAEVNDSLGAFPYGEYRMQELRCENNEGFKLLDITFFVEEDSTKDMPIDLGTLTDDEILPEIRTVARDKDTGSHMAKTGEKTVIIDTVHCVNLIKGRSYVLKATLMDQDEKAVKSGFSKVTGETVFTASDTVMDVEVELDAFDTAAYAGTTLTVYEKLFEKNLIGTGRELASHEELQDTDQQVVIPEIKTNAADAGTESHTGNLNAKARIHDTVTYRGLLPGQTYTVKGHLMLKPTNNEAPEALVIDGKLVSAEKTFTPSEAEGSVTLTFTLDSTILAGRTVVVFESLEYEGIEIAAHADINDANQSIYYPQIRTTATAKDTNSHETTSAEEITVIDRVDYSNVIPGRELTIRGCLMLKGSGKVLTVDGKEVTAEVTFTPDKAEGSVDLVFTFNASALGGETVVAFERMYDGEELIAMHEDLQDPDQSVVINKPEIPVTPTPTTPTPTTPKTPTPTTPTVPRTIEPQSTVPVKTGDAAMPVLWASLMTAAGAAGIYVTRKRRK